MFGPNELYQDYMKENAYLIRWIQGNYKYLISVKYQIQYCHVREYCARGILILIFTIIIYNILIVDSNFDLNLAKNKLRKVQISLIPNPQRTYSIVN